MCMCESICIHIQAETNRDYKSRSRQSCRRYHSCRRRCTETSIQCMLGHGARGTWRAHMIVMGPSGSTLEAYSADVRSLSAVSYSNVPASGLTLIIVLGEGLGWAVHVLVCLYFIDSLIFFYPKSTSTDSLIVSKKQGCRGPLKNL